MARAAAFTGHEWGTPFIPIEWRLLFTELTDKYKKDIQARKHISSQSYKSCTIVNYDSRVILAKKLHEIQLITIVECL